MIISDFEIAQASLEFFGMLVCLIMVIITILNKNTNKSMRMFKWMFLVTAFILFFDGCAYIYRGNLDLVSIYMTRISNYMVFFLNIVLALLFYRYVCSLIIEKNEKPGALLKWFIYICLVITGSMLVINMFSGWMFSFDEKNYYHREYVWYIYTLLMFFAVLGGSFSALEKRKALGRPIILAVLAYSVFPVVAMAIQIIYYGISITNIGLVVCLIIMMLTYIFTWSKDDINDHEIESSNKRGADLILLFAMMVVVMSASIISCVISINRMSIDKAKDDGKTVADMVYNSVYIEFLKPISVSKTMAYDEFLINYLEEGGDEPYEVEKNIKEYLDLIRSKFNYQNDFAVSHKSQAYYTFEGITRFIGDKLDDNDQWYTDVQNEQGEYNLNIDYDADNDYLMSLFVNHKIYNNAGDFVGVCGVCVQMTELEKLLDRIEKEYDLEIYLIDKDGLIQLDSSGKGVEKTYLDNSYLEEVTATDFYKSEQEEHAIYTRFVTDLGWYLVIDNKSPNDIDIIGITWPSIVIFLGGLGVMGIIFGIIALRNRKTNKALVERRRIALTDEMTGLYNRRAFEEDTEKIKKSNVKEDIVVVMMDVNGLKFVNDNLGHIAGDELIIGAGNCMTTTLGRLGKIYRIGGDEFAALLRCDKMKVEEAFVTFDHIVPNWKGTVVKELAVSKGYIAWNDYLDKSLEEIMEMADKLMYADKDEYYKRTGKKRRT